jgi:hypothetical protein
MRQWIATPALAKMVVEAVYQTKELSFREKADVAITIGKETKVIPSDALASCSSPRSATIGSKQRDDHIDAGRFP